MLERIYHLGYAVHDIEAATRFYVKTFGVQPSEPEAVEEQGIVATMFRVGESQIELVQPTRPDSPVGKFLARRGEGFHHVCFEVENLAETLTRLELDGLELIDTAPRRGAEGPVAFIHPRSCHGVLVELIEAPGGPAWSALGYRA